MEAVLSNQQRKMCIEPAEFHPSAAGKWVLALQTQGAPLAWPRLGPATLAGPWGAGSPVEKVDEVSVTESSSIRNGSGCI